jgi:hypothetical protein
MPHPVHTRPSPAVLVGGYPGDLRARRGHVCLDRAALADVARLGERRPAPWWSGRPVACGNRVIVVEVGQRRVARSVPDLYWVPRGPGMTVQDALMTITRQPQLGRCYGSLVRD